MLKILFISVILFCTLSLAHAETCPTIADIKANHLKGWRAFDLDNAEPLEPDAWADYQQAVAHFGMAYWMVDAPEGSGHCAYSGVEPDESFLNVFLAKQTGEPDESAGGWYNAGYDVKECKSTLAACRYK